MLAQASSVSAADPFISEVMSANDTTLRDSFSNSPDWIEIYNPNDQPFSLADWSLTDDPQDLQKWTFPKVSIDARQFLVIFASGESKTETDGELHTGFRLARDGEYLGLVKPDGTIASEFKPELPALESDQSYGVSMMGDGETLLPVDPTNMVFLFSPTPGSINTAGAVGKAGEPIFSVPAGTFVTSFELELSSSHADEEVRYTLNGSMPTSGSTLYTEPVAIETSVVVRARCFRQGSIPGSSVSQGYLKLGGNLHNFSSNLPVVVVQDFKDGNILPDPYQSGYMMVHEPGGEDRRTRLTDAPTLETRIGIKLRGSSTQDRPKKAFAVEAWDEHDEDKNITPLNMPEDSDWVLYASYEYDRALIRNAFIYEISNQIGRYAVRTRFCEVFVNTDGGSLDYEDYVGVYVFMEKITRGRDRVDIRRIRPENNVEPEITGGYLLKFDRADPGDSGFIALGQNNRIMWVDPKENEVTVEQAKWVKDYLNSMYKSLRSSDPETGYPKYIDADSWIDHHILNELTKNGDAFTTSCYFYKDRGKRVEYGPLWDFDRTMGPDNNSSFGPAAVNPVDWSTKYFSGWWGRLMRNKDFKRRYIERWNFFRQHAMSEKNLFAVIDAMADELDEAAGRNYTKWPLITSTGGFRIEIAQLKDWISKRLAWIDSQYQDAPPPTLSSKGGVVLPGFRLQLSSSGGDVHYTTDGTDPRMPDDSKNPNAETLSISNADMVISRDSVWKYLDDGTRLDDVQWTPLDYDDSQWKSGPAELGYGDDDEATAVNKGGSVSKTHNTIYFRRHFTLKSVNRGDRLLLELLRDDGAVVYLNGTEIIRSNMPSGTVLYSTMATSKNNLKQSRLWHSHVIESPSIKKGENVIAVEVHRFNKWDRDLSFNLELGSLDASGSWITINESTAIIARTNKGKDWSPRVKATFVVSEAAPLKITEIMYNPMEGNALEFIELKNLSSQPLALEGISLEGVNFQFEDGTLMPWQAGVLIPNNDPEAFSRVYPGVTILGLYGGNLSNGGELLRIHDAEKQVTFEVEYGDSGDWPEEADGTGHSLELANPAGNPKDFRNWRASALPGGSPGDVLEISVVALEPGRVQIRFFALPGNSYTLRYTDNVASSQWMRLHQKKFMANPKEVEFIDTVPGNVQRRFYRISVP
uniref:LTD domain-containing protein n=2 Tax=Gammaproteobacteria TaxID=1236 RepID=E7C6S6_9GAMM|nr:hypothetical protein [uncultured Oceanospirillales bacterium HF0500_29K23]ADI23150.1 hypothetical protein [uncultured gamma proteobacterium HF0770_11A05]